ncbi:MAG: 3-deoxy-manno-octulosonate cytidylyltransferase [Candidatus Hydrogenedens sp.]|nr:3-deoxy-manno-octulosonate cytidylyltransferase [Candidatus Hydrogenedens sp.]
MPVSVHPKVLAVIPARYASERFPGKMIVELEGKPLVYHAYARACKASLIDEVVVAADDERIADALAPYGVNVVMTSPDHTTGTDRVAEVAAQADAEIIVNVQGDEALIDPQVIDDTIRPLLREPDVAMSTACHALTDPAKIADPNIVKVVRDSKGHAIYFSRAPIPHVRGGGATEKPVHFQHIGLYVFRRDFVIVYANMAPTPLEQLEKLEQLRAIENGYKIAVVETDYRCIGVDTPADLEEVRTLLAAERGA